MVDPHSPVLTEGSLSANSNSHIDATKLESEQVVIDQRETASASVVDLDTTPPVPSTTPPSSSTGSFQVVRSLYLPSGSDAMSLDGIHQHVMNVSGMKSVEAIAAAGLAYHQAINDGASHLRIMSPRKFSRNNKLMHFFETESVN